MSGSRAKALRRLFRTGGPPEFQTRANWRRFKRNWVRTQHGTR